MEYGELTHEIIGAAIEVHKVLGPGFLEAIYQRALFHELFLRKLSVRAETSYEIRYKGELIGRPRLDIVVSGKVIVELKCASEITNVHFAQAMSYLKASGLRVALILNFGSPSLTWRRIIK